MKKIILIATAMLIAQVSLANEISDKIKSAQENEIFACVTPTEKGPLYVFVSGEIYKSKSGRLNPLEISDYEFFAKVESLLPNKGTLFDFMIGDKVYQADFVEKAFGQNIYFIQSIMDDGGQTTSGTLLNNGIESNLSCADVTLYK